jgi:hypothetical protein
VRLHSCTLNLLLIENIYYFGGKSKSGAGTTEKQAGLHLRWVPLDLPGRGESADRVLLDGIRALAE